MALWKILSLNNNSRSLDNYGIHCFNLAVLTCSEFRNQQGMFSSVSFDLLKVSYGFRSRWNAYNIQKYLVFWLYLLLLCIILLEEQMIRKIRFSDLCIHTGKQVNIYTYVIYTHIYLYVISICLSWILPKYFHVNIAIALGLYILNKMPGRTLLLSPKEY